MSIEEKDKLYEFLSLMCTRLLGVGGDKIKVHKVDGSMVLGVPFKALAIYGIVTALQDAGEVNFILTVKISVAHNAQPTVEVVLRPSLRSWAWGMFKEREGSCTLGELVRFYALDEGADEERRKIMSRLK